MLDAMIVSAWKKLLDRHKSNVRRNTTDLTRRLIAYMIYEHFRATGVYEAVHVQHTLAE